MRPSRSQVQQEDTFLSALNPQACFLLFLESGILGSGDSVGLMWERPLQNIRGT